MNLTLAENMRNLRQKKGNTQDELAEFLNMSKQSVSKWERDEGYPDITLLPRIASYYDTTVDDLLGCGEIEKRRRLEEFEKQMHTFDNQNRMEEYSALCREMLSEYPNEKVVLEYRMYALGHEDRLANADEIIRIAERLLASNDPAYRLIALRELTLTYWFRNDWEQAKKYASMTDCREDLLRMVLRGEERLHHCREYFWELCDTMYGYMSYLLDGDDGMTPAEKYDAARLAYDLYHRIFTDGDFGFFEDRLASLCCDLARFSLGLGERERALGELEEALAHCLLYDKFASIDHTSPLVRGYHYDEGMTGRAGCSGTAAWLLEEMCRREFDPIREAARFKEVERRLNDAKKVYLQKE